MNASPVTRQNWQSSLEPILASLEAERRDACKATTTAAYIIAGLTFLAFIILLLNDKGMGIFSLVLPLVAGIAIYAFVHSQYASSYRNGFKSRVLPLLVHHCANETGGTLTYLANQGIPENEFRNSGLFRSPDRYSSEDLVHGKIGETALHFSEVHAEYRQVRSNGKTTTVTYHTIFKGLFLIADFNKEFQGVTYVKPDVAQSLFGRFGQSMQQLGATLSLSGRELVRLENPEFEQAFVVYSTDQIEARYILSPSLMERLLRFRARCDTDIHIAFIGGQMIVAVPYSAAWLEAPSLGIPLTVESLRTCLDQLNFAIGVVGDMDLNTRIWSK